MRLRCRGAGRACAWASAPGLDAETGREAAPDFSETASGQRLVPVGMTGFEPAAQIGTHAADQERDAVLRQTVRAETTEETVNRLWDHAQPGSAQLREMAGALDGLRSSAMRVRMGRGIWLGPTVLYRSDPSCRA